MVVDTDVASFLFNRYPVRTPRYAPHLQGRTLIFPFAVVGEMLFGAEHRNWGAARRLELERFIRRGKIEYPNYPLCEIGAEIRVIARKRGWAIERQDAWVAATAIYLDLPLVTHNAPDYAGVPTLQVITEPDRQAER
ncbi:MAG: PIN domain-containing protein [Armatimonadota bacterium]